MVIFPKQSLAVGVLTVLYQGPLPGDSLRRPCQGIENAAIYSTSWHRPGFPPASGAQFRKPQIQTWNIKPEI